MSDDDSDDGGYVHVPRIAAAVTFERLARYCLDGKRDFPLDLLPDFQRAYLEVLEKLRALEAEGSLSQQTTDIVNALVALGMPLEEARTKVAKASGSPRKTVVREHNKRKQPGKVKPRKRVGKKPT